MKKTITVSPYIIGGPADGTVETTVEFKELNPFNWLEVLEELADGATISNFEDLLLRAQEWPTCACGQLCKRLPRGRTGYPLDTYAYELGVDFNNAVKARDWAGALRRFKQIEQRTAELLS